MPYNIYTNQYRLISQNDKPNSLQIKRIYVTFRFEFTKNVLPSAVRQRMSFMGKLSKWFRHSLLCTVNLIRLSLIHQNYRYEDAWLAEIVERHSFNRNVSYLVKEEKEKSVLDVKRHRINIVTKIFNSIWMYNVNCAFFKGNK